MEPLEVKLTHEGPTASIGASGYLDIATEPRLREALRDAMDNGAERVVLNLEELSFCDSTGIRLLVTTYNDARESKREFAIVRPRPAVFRVFEICGMAGYLPFTPAAETA